MAYGYGRRGNRRRRRLIMKRITIGAACLLLTGGLLSGGIILGKNLINGHNPGTDSTLVLNPTTEDPLINTAHTEEVEITIEIPTEPLLEQAALLAAGYDYDAAIELLQGDATLQNHPLITEAIASYETTKTTLVRANIGEITHIFFHSLVIDNQKAFDGDSDEGGYNQVMTTESEFMKILESMYAKGFVLVRLHDMAYETVDENGKMVMNAGDIMLPPGKKAFVMSQDDVCYYPYMDGDGFASRMIVGEDGKPTTEMKMDDGSISVGAYDLVPMLEDFIQEHPDFSYKGARAVLAFTGYEGILGYRTADSYKDSPTYEQDREDAAKVAQCLRDNGWELASHSWGHRNLGSTGSNFTTEEQFRTDSDKWEDQVESLIGSTDIILFPFGSDIGSWKPYTTDNTRFTYLQSLGFRYFCNVDSAQYWVQLGDTYMRQGRRNLDGYRLWNDIITEDSTKRKLEDLFHAEDVFDKDRPTPVPDM